MSVPILVGIPLESNIIIPTSLTRHIRLSDLLRTQIKIRMCGLQAPDSFIVNSHELSFPCGSPGKESTCHAGYLGSISGLGRFPWRRERLPTPVFWLGEFHGLYSPWGHKESDTTEQLSLSFLSWIKHLMCTTLHAKKDEDESWKIIQRLNLLERLYNFWSFRNSVDIHWVSIREVWRFSGSKARVVLTPGIWPAHEDKDCWKSGSQ